MIAEYVEALAASDGITMAELQDVADYAVVRLKELSKENDPDALTALARVLELCGDMKTRKIDYQKKEAVNTRTIMALLGAA
jgi:hypothetical protein